jgi:glucan phosphorylase
VIDGKALPGTEIMQVAVDNGAFRVSVWDGWVIDTSNPAIRWMVGHREDQIAIWAQRHDGDLRKIADLEQIGG